MAACESVHPQTRSTAGALAFPLVLGYMVLRRKKCDRIYLTIVFIDIKIYESVS